MYNINILTECNDENIRVAIITAVLEMLNGGTSSLNITRMKHGRLNSPIWNSVIRREKMLI